MRRVIVVLLAGLVCGGVGCAAGDSDGGLDQGAASAPDRRTLEKIEDVRRRLGTRGDFKIPQRALAGKSANDVWWTAIERIFWEFLHDPFDEPRLQRLTAGQRTLYVLHLTEFELYNGGFDQFYTNSTGYFARDVPRALRRVGAFAHARVAERANAILAGAGREVPRGRAQRIALAERASTEALDEVDEAWYGLGDGTSRRLLARQVAAYVRAHPDEFIADSS